MNAHFHFYIILSNYVRSILFYENKDHNVRQIRFHVCIKMHRCKREALFGQPNKWNSWKEEELKESRQGWSFIDYLNNYLDKVWNAGKMQKVHRIANAGIQKLCIF